MIKTSKAKVLDTYPKAMAEAYRNPQGRITHYLVWSGPTYATLRLRLGSGKTRNTAWDDAAINSQASQTHISQTVIAAAQEEEGSNHA